MNSYYGNHSPQVLLLNAVRDVANALSNLIDTTRAASGKSVHDPAMEKLKTSAKVSAPDSVDQITCCTVGYGYWGELITEDC